MRNQFLRIVSLPTIFDHSIIDFIGHLRYRFEQCLRSNAIKIDFLLCRGHSSGYSPPFVKGLLCEACTRSNDEAHNLIELEAERCSLDSL